MFDKVSITQIGKLYGVSRQAVAKWCAAGCPRRPDGCFDLAQVIQWRESKLADTAADGGSPALEEWRTARAEREKLRLRREQNEVVEWSAATAFWIDRVTAATTALRSVGQAVASSCAGQDAATIKATVDDRLRFVCAALSRDWLAATVQELCYDEKERREVEEFARASGGSGRLALADDN